MVWDGAKATGPILYQSSPQATTQLNVFQTFTFNTGGVPVVPGNQYVLFLNASNYPTSGTGRLASPQSNPYSGGDFFFLNNGGTFGSITTANWASFGAFDAAFTATFNTPTAPRRSPSPSRPRSHCSV